MRHVIPDHLGYLLDEDAGAEAVLHLMVLPDGRPVTLRGTAATIWALALETDDVVGELAAMVGRARDEIAAETEDFLADLVLQGFLEPAPTPGRRTAAPPGKPPESPLPNPTSQDNT